MPNTHALAVALDPAIWKVRWNSMKQYFENSSTGSFMKMVQTAFVKVFSLLDLTDYVEKEAKIFLNLALVDKRTVMGKCKPQMSSYSLQL